MISFFRHLIEKFEKTDEQRPRVELNLSDFSAIYAIGDIHGCMGLLQTVYNRILEDQPGISGRKLVVFLGDYVDRGTSSQAVLDFLSRPTSDEVQHICICGNHDLEFLRFLRDAKSNMGWLGFGGEETLRSYGIDAEHILRSGGGLAVLTRVVGEAVPKHHVRFLESMPTMLTVGKLIFVHAGIRPGVPLDKQTDEDLMWIREPFLTDGPKLPFLVVHGHTITPEPVFASGHVGIDTGAFATGRLTVLRICQGKASILQ